MPDNKRKTRLDRTRIDVHDYQEIRSWCKSLGVTAVRLRAAVKAVGTSATKVRAYMRSDSWAKGTRTEQRAAS